MMRYFAAVTIDDKPLALFRFGVFEDRIVDEVFRHGAWHDAEHTMARALTLGSNEYEALTDEQARELFPAAFEAKETE